MDTFCDLSVCPLLSLVSSLLESRSVPALTRVTRSVEPSGPFRSVTVDLNHPQPTKQAVERAERGRFLQPEVGEP